MALKTYVGARYAPRFMGAWDRANEYAALSVVYHDNQSYVSRKTVPAETEITNTGFWIRSSDWNAQVDEYRNQVDAYDEKVVQYNQNVEAYNAAANQFFDETIHAYNTKEDMVNDESVKVGYTLITCGETAIGDGGGSFYQVVEETSSGAVALKNGLFAKKFQLMPERFNRYSVSNVTDLTNMSLAVGDEVNFIGTSGAPVDGYDLSNNDIKLPFAIHSAIYMGEAVSVADTNDNTLIKFNKDNKVFKINTVTPYMRCNQDVTLTLLPENYGYNYSVIIDHPAHAAKDSYVIGTEKEYLLKFQGNSAITKTIKVKTPSTEAETITLMPMSCDYYVTLKYNGEGITTTVYPVGGQCVIPEPATNSAGASNTFKLKINGHSSFYQPVFLGSTADSLILDFDTLRFYCSETDTPILITCYIPFNNKSTSTVRVYPTGTLLINGNLKTIHYRGNTTIPSGSSFWMMMLGLSNGEITFTPEKLG